MGKERERRAKPSATRRKRPAGLPAAAPKAASGKSAGGRGAGRAHSAPGSRKLHAAAMRQAILDAALAVFAERGYEAARLDDVAAKAGVAKGTLYLYFKDKEALFEALVRGAVSPLMDQAGQAAAIPGME